MGAPKKADWREARRKRAWRLKEQGWKQKNIAVVERGSGESMTQTRARAGRGSAQCSSSPRNEATADCRTENTDPTVISQGSGGLWLSRRCVASPLMAACFCK